MTGPIQPTPARWDEVAQTYDLEIAPAERQLAEEVGAVLRSAGIMPGARLLELGSGSGHLSAVLAQQGFDVTLLDFSTAALAKSRATFDQYRLSGRFLEGDLTNLPGDLGPYDLVWNSGVMEHFDDAALHAAFASISRVPATQYFFIVPNPDSFPYLLFRYRAIARGEWHWGWEALRRDYAEIMAGAGLHVNKTFYLGEKFAEGHLRYALQEPGFALDRLIQLGIVKDYEMYLIGFLAHTDQRPELAAPAPDQHRSNATSYQTEIFDLNAQLAGWQRHADTWEARERELEQANRALVAAHAAELERARSAYEAEAERMRTALEAAHAARDTVRRQLDAIRAELGAARAELVEHHVTIQQTSAEVQQTNRTLREIALRLRALAKTKPYRLAHLFRRLERGLIKGRRQDKLLTLRWLKRRMIGRQVPLEETQNPLLHEFVLLQGASAALESLTSDRLLLRGPVTQAQKPTPVHGHPPLPLPEIMARAAAAPAGPDGATAMPRESFHDLVCFPIIDWDFRFQRPQQLMSRYAEAGHRVFYLAQNFRTCGEPYQVTAKAANVFEVSLRGPHLNVYRDTLAGPAADALFASLDALRKDLGLGATAGIVQLPFWWPLARRMREQFAWRVIYDCMDHHAGFSTNTPEMTEQEDALLRGADLVVVSSPFLERKARRQSSNVLLVRNACEYERFAAAAPPHGARPVIGYYGAIADWFDTALVADLAERRLDWDFVLVGSTFSADVTRLSKLPNVSFAGEKPYAEIPEWLGRFDVAIIPFCRTPLTEATNPVKAYEILASGRPIVAVPIPEMVLLSPLVRLAEDAHGFEREIEAALAENDPAAVERRRAFARENTWRTRFEALAPAIAKTFPKASVIIVTYNNLDLNRACLESIYARTEWPNLEVIVVDNASQDGTPAYLREAEGTFPNLRVLLEEKNLGFAAGNNVGLQTATGEFIVLLNNDTVVSRRWLTHLIRHLHAEPKIGLLGPVTNEIANEAKVAVGYDQIEAMPEWAARYTSENDGRVAPIPMLAMFCVATRRSVVDAVGLLDERFGIGMFEDDDYNRRVRHLGYNIRYTHDSFVHHVQKASFRLLGETEYLRLFDENRKKYEEKWGQTWAAEGVRVWQRSDLGFYREQLAQVTARIRQSRGAVIFLPSVGWGIHLFQRPHHLARTFARLGWVSIFDCSNAHDDVNGFKEIEPNLWLFRGPEDLLHEIPDPLLWAFPYNFDRKDGYPHSARVVYDWIDDLEVFPYTRSFLEQNHARALKEAEIVASVARRLHAQALMVRPDGVYLPNGVEVKRFADDSVPIPNDADIAMFRDQGRPVAGYYGALASWFDYELVEAVAREKRDWNFLLIGPMYDESLQGRPMLRCPNVAWIGPRDYHALPGYLKLFDVAMIPFRINNITLATSPLKLYEYFAGGKPVVTTPMPECQAHPEVHIAADAGAFSRALEAARQEGADPAFRNRLRTLARENSWEARIDVVLRALEKKKGSPQPTAPHPARLHWPSQPTGNGGDITRRGDSAGAAERSLGRLRSRKPPRLTGKCNVCGEKAGFYCDDLAVARESLTCSECLTTSRYRSIARGLLRAIGELAGVEAGSLADLSRKTPQRGLSIYDTQVPFYFEKNAYPIPDILKRCDWIDVQTSLYRPDEPRGANLGQNTTNQNLECLTFPDARFDIVVTSDVMEHVRLDDLAHREIRRVLKPRGVYLFTVPHFRDRKTYTRVRVIDPMDPSKDEFIEREYHGDANSTGEGALSYRSYGIEYDDYLRELGFAVDFSREDLPEVGILGTELFYCRRSEADPPPGSGDSHPMP